MTVVLLLTKVAVGLIDPVGAGRMKNVDSGSVFERLGLVRHVGRDGENFASPNHDFFAVDPELQGTGKDHAELLIDVTMHGHDAAFSEEKTRQHYVLTDDELPLQKRVHDLALHIIPDPMPHSGGTLRLSYSPIERHAFGAFRRGGSVFICRLCHDSQSFVSSAIHENGLARNVGSARRSKPYDGVGHLARVGHALDSGIGCPRSEDFILALTLSGGSRTGKLSQAIRPSVSRTNIVDQDAILTELIGQALY